MDISSGRRAVQEHQVNEYEFIAEVVHPETGQPVKEGEKGELVRELALRLR